jgi:alpha-amylase
MPAICFYFQVHQPMRIKHYSVFDIGRDHDYFDAKHSDTDNHLILNKVSEKCYLPTNELLLNLLTEYQDFKVSFSLSGVFLEQIETDFPEVLESFQKLVATSRVEILAETYYHSLSFLYSRKEFLEQVKLHSAIVQRLFGVTPKVFRNTELIYNNELALVVEELGYTGIITEGVDRVLGWRNSNFVYTPKGCDHIKLLLKNYQLSDDIAFRFSNKDWEEHPLTAPKFTSWLNKVNGDGEVVNLFMDYETFGEHQWADSGIFDFLRALPGEFLSTSENSFVTPSEAVTSFEPKDVVDIEDFVSWADSERDLSAWRSNDLQYEALSKIYSLEKAIKDTGNQDLIQDWRRFTTSDHFYYMCTKYWSDGDVHKYFSPYQSPYDAFLYFMNALKDLELRLDLMTQK